MNISRKIHFNKVKEVMNDNLQEVRIAKRQMTFGDLVEHNLFNAIEDSAEGNYCKIARTSRAQDYNFGADAKFTFSHYSNDRIDGMSTFIDFTLNRDKKSLLYYFYDEHNRQDGLNRNRVVLDTLDCGMELSVALKTANTSFRYKKPVIVIMLCNTGGGIVNPIFTDSDVAKIVTNVRRCCYYSSYKFVTTFDNQEIMGCGKQSSEVIELHANSYLVATLEQ